MKTSTDTKVSAKHLKELAWTPAVDCMFMPFDEVYELAMSEHRKKIEDLINRLKDTVSDDEWMLIVKLDIAAGCAIDLARAVGFVCGSISGSNDV